MKNIIPFLVVVFSLSVQAENGNLDKIFRNESIRTMDSSVARYDFSAKKKNLFYVWASWCPYCKRDIPKFMENYENVKDCYNLGVSFINVDDDKEKGGKAIKELKIDGVPVFHSSKNAISDVASGGGIPKLIITDDRGVVLEVHTGLGATVEPVNALKKALEEKGDCRR